MRVASVIHDSTAVPPAAPPPRVRRTVGRTALLYALVAAVWIVGSDSLLGLLELSPVAATLAQTAKGWFFVAASAIFFFLALRAAAGAAGADEPAPSRRVRSWIPIALIASIALALAVLNSIGLIVVRETTRIALEKPAPTGQESAVPGAAQPPHLPLAARRLEQVALAAAALTAALLAAATAGVGLWYRGDRRAAEAEQRMLRSESERLAARELAATEERARRALAAANLELEARVAARTVELEGVNRELASANRELDGFVSSVSHDLRAPLRSIDGFARVLAEEHATALDAEGLRLLGVVRGGAARMGRLIDDLLRFARASRVALAPERVEMRALVDEVFAELVPVERRAALDFECGPLPAVRGDSSLLRQVWQNLLANALKFSAGSERPRIRVSARREGDRVEFRVDDNGVGFDPRHAGRLFGIFERLHSERDFPGTGVGLALVGSIVARHGGGVGGDGEPGRGAKFWFWLPAVETGESAPGREPAGREAAPPR